MHDEGVGFGDGNSYSALQVCTATTSATPQPTFLLSEAAATFIGA